MRLSLRLTVQLRGGLGALVTVLLVASIEADAGAWGSWDAGSHVQTGTEASWAPQARTAVGGATDSLSMDAKLYGHPGTPAETNTVGTFSWESKSMKPDHTVTGKLTLEDLPVDAAALRPPSAPRAQKSQKRSMATVIADFFRRPHLFKFGLFILALAISFFVVGVFAKIGLVLLSVWLAFKVLQFFENRYDLS